MPPSLLIITPGTCSRRIAKHHGIIIAISEHVVSIKPGARGYKPVGIEKPPNLGVVVPALEIIEPGIGWLANVATSYALGFTRSFIAIMPSALDNFHCTTIQNSVDDSVFVVYFSAPIAG